MCIYTQINTYYLQLQIFIHSNNLHDICKVNYMEILETKETQKKSRKIFYKVWVFAYTYKSNVCYNDQS